jgi:SAM-dependent methyltransferase
MMNTHKSIADYYQNSDNELARRYLRQIYPEFTAEYFQAALAHRYGLYPHLPLVAEFDAFAGKELLEIGVGQGADHYMFAKNGARMHGVDLTPKHCEITRLFLDTFELSSDIRQADARALPFGNEAFDHVYACGVLLLIRDIRQAVSEIWRVLKAGGTATIMLYNKNSLHYWIKTRFYYGWALQEDRFLGKDTVDDWYTDGINYPKVWYYRPADLPRLFSRFSRIFYQTACLDPGQLPLFEIPAALQNKLESNFGWFLWVKVTK